MLSGPTGTAAVSNSRGLFNSCDSASKASRNSDESNTNPNDEI
jgi:hypothetical protein